ncbi:MULTISPECIES: NADPH:quinone oxidoreductase family protein [Thiomonas]|uniref:NADPH:quinone oxidoreductase family protein n=1 Tax=Thiomonas arsenitoxydans (strain DSM 22701 / CIP 110005 / 3As) TaxID=426114 RepID=A0A8I1STJ2_THIA3|nr:MULTISPECIES: NADPH:quinone oxidoreductase family protein [Thiomonas]MBN8743555.1 NADPH:quinone oxidoreductase family protein [Thiomonas arsenitoxydans]MBN8776962.1 NADPH:quinone oxidoreductase family protein [Thiomonas arsenitoxydans]ODU98103.1 MAG: NADPH:quinone oxidoreductase [Thiomonas sp. SCN 64-16]
MKALLCTAYGPIDTLRLQDAPDPVPAAGEVVVAVRACALNFPDALIVQGLYQAKPALPFSPGAEFSGIILQVGADVTAYKPGDAVIAFAGHGGLAERCAVDAQRIMPLPSGMSFEQGAAFMLTYGTCIHALKDVAQLQPGETLAVLGAGGGVGLAAVDIAKAMGARVIAAASTKAKLELAQQHGADTLLDYASEDLRQRLMGLTEGKGADVVLDPVGGVYAEAALRATAWRGRYLVVGFAAGDIPRIPLNLALLKERQILGVYWGEAVQRNPRQHAANVRQLLQWFVAGSVRPEITEQLGLEQATQALLRLSQREAKGKIVVRIMAESGV